MKITTLTILLFVLVLAGCVSTVKQVSPASRVMPMGIDPSDTNNWSTNGIPIVGQGFPGPDTNFLWLSISQTGTNMATLKVNNAIPSHIYYLWAKTNLLSDNWIWTWDFSGVRNYNLVFSTSIANSLFFRTEDTTP